jgi:hypothetical protein
VTWSTPADLKQQVLRLWERGVLARSLINGGQDLPIRLVLKTPSSSELTHEFERVRSWVASLRGISGVRLEWREVRHRVHGQQSLPAEAWIHDLDEALALLGKKRDGRTLQIILEETRRLLPELEPWIERRPLQAIEQAESWPGLLALIHWVRLHPRPGIYLRQVDIPGVDTKFIEAHRGIIAELASLALGLEGSEKPPRASHLAEDLGFLEKPVRIRFRSLDPDLGILQSAALMPDITLDAESFGGLNLQVSRVFILENEINFLSFPKVTDAIAIFGSGYGWDALSKATWLNKTSVFYWGDIDTHGFAILNQLRGHLPAVESFLMDRETLLEHECFWGKEKYPARGHLDYLRPEEDALYHALIHGELGEGIRLEQERVSYSKVIWALTQILEKGL